MNRLLRTALRTCGLYDVVVDLKHWLAGTDSQYLPFYSQFVHRGDLCFDIGANVGHRTQVLLQLGASVVAVEPQQHCMARLRKKYGTDKRVILIQEAVGETVGQGEMMICDSHSLSSLSGAWVKSVRSSGRYAQCNWSQSLKVRITTLDALISKYGQPAFIKIDVEGYEWEVLKGLSQSVRALCFEFTPEFIDSAAQCVRHISSLGPARFNYCLDAKPTTFCLPQWVNYDEMHNVLHSLGNGKQTGDIYARSNV